ncbi:hypothetical protein [Yoonia sp. SS1-5]|uniref:Uncharacterized protein n=1 Tax=Yoonia rhodophyticola TaxID=3137370 RepID=A0AAN0MGT8_9RHOB
MSVDRFLLVIFSTIILTFPAMAAWGWLQPGNEDKSLISFLEMLETLPGFVVVSLFFGWIVWIPVALIALVVGMPLWISALKFFAKKNVRQRMSVVIATLLVVCVTTLGTDIFFMTLSASPHGAGRFAVTIVFGPAAAVIAIVITQLLYGFD